MKPTESEIEELQNLERTADNLLAEIAASPQHALRDSMYTLEHIAARATKIAYGASSPAIVSQQMQDLITWTDHLNDESWRVRFEQALRTRPLISPWK